MVNGSGVGVSGSHGSLLSDYAISYANTTGTITPKAATVTAATDTKAYDGTIASSASVTNITGLLSGDSLAGLTQAYNSAHAQGANGSLLVVNGSGASVSGSHGSVLGDDMLSSDEEPEVIRLDLPVAGNTKKVSDTFVRDLTSHPWAGLKVTVMLTWPSAVACEDM